jgi:hypothetical protein
MRYRVTVRVSKTVTLEREGKDADDAMSRINFAEIPLEASDYLVEIEPIE